jgi:hypothetical protein
MSTIRPRKPAVSPGGAAGGDLSGDYPEPLVMGLEGYPLEAPPPANGDTITFNTALQMWEHNPPVSTGGNPIGPAGGDLSGSYPNPTVAKILGRTLSSSAPATGNSLVWNGTQWAPATPGATGSAGGDLTGSYPSPTLVAVGSAATYGSASQVAVVTTDSKGRVSSASNTSIQITETQVTDLTTHLGDKANKTITVSAGTGLSGGGDLSANRTISMPSVGTAGTYGSSIVIPVITTDAQGRVSGVTNTALSTALSSAAFPRIGKTLLVDSVNGVDATAAVNGLPFLTVEGAISYINANSLTGVTVWIAPGTYALSAGITVPATCSLRGLSLQTCRLTLAGSNPGGTVTMITMGENTRVEDLSITLTSTNTTTNLTGISFTGTTSVTSKIRTCVITVDNSTLAVGTSTNVYGVNSSGSGVIGPATFSFNALKGSTINVISNGGGNKFGIYMPPGAGSANEISTRDMNIYVAAPVTSTSTGLYVGVYTFNADSQIQMRSTSVGGPSYPAVQLALPVLIRTDSNITLTAPQTIQGISLVANNRVLVAAQTTGTENGIYIVGAGAWTRALDMQAGTAASGIYTLVTEGTYINTGWECTTVANVGAASLTFAQRYFGGDILQQSPQAGFGTNGIQVGPGTDIVNKTGCSHPFTTYVTPTTLAYSVNAILGNAPRYLWPGVMSTGGDSTEIYYRFQQKSIVQGMSINMRTGPGVGNTVTFTVYKSKTGAVGSGVPTQMVATVSGTSTTGSNYITSVDFAQGDYLAIRADKSGGSPEDIVVEVDIF